MVPSVLALPAPPVGRADMQEIESEAVVAVQPVALIFCPQRQGSKSQEETQMLGFGNVLPARLLQFLRLTPRPDDLSQLLVAGHCHSIAQLISQRNDALPVRCLPIIGRAAA